MCPGKCKETILPEITRPRNATKWDCSQWLTEEEWNAISDWMVVEHTDSREPVQGEQKKEFQSRKSGTIGPYTFQATIYNMPSQYGVREGNILNLELRLAATGKTVAYFDHEWLISPDDENIHGVIESLVYHYEASEDTIISIENRDEIKCDRCGKPACFDEGGGNCPQCGDDLCIECAERWHEDEDGVCDRCFRDEKDEAQIAAVLEPSMKAEVKEKNKDLIAFGTLQTQ